MPLCRRFLLKTSPTFPQTAAEVLKLQSKAVMWSGFEFFLKQFFKETQGTKRQCNHLCISCDFQNPQAEVCIFH